MPPTTPPFRLHLALALLAATLLALALIAPPLSASPLSPVPDAAAAAQDDGDGGEGGEDDGGDDGSGGDDQGEDEVTPEEVETPESDEPTPEDDDEQTPEATTTPESDDDNASPATQPTPEGDEDDGSETRDDDGEDEQQVQVDPAEVYLVAVACAYVPADDRSTCGFAGLTERGAGDISGIVVPAAAVCAEVIDGIYVESDDPTGEPGYGSPADAGPIVILDLAGEVTTDGTATHWVTTGDAVQPATGPGLSCGSDEDSADGTSMPTDVGTDVTDTTGAIVVQAYECGAVPDGAEIDWFAECDPAAPGIDLTLAGTGDEDSPESATTDDGGEVVFGDLSPGTYDLTETNGAWCHAESDSVDAGGNLTVTAGERATVWIFHCD